MNSNSGLSGIFPSDGTIPDQFNIADPIEQRHYLCNGVMEEWCGPLQEVVSPVLVATENGLRRKTLSVSDALRVFTIRTLVAAKQNEANKKLIRTILKGRKSRFLSTDFIL